MHEYIFNHISGQIPILAENITQAYQEFDNFLKMHRKETPKSKNEVKTAPVTPQIISSTDPKFTNSK